MAQKIGQGRDRELTKELIHEAFEEADAPVMTIGDIANCVLVSRQTVHRTLVGQGMAEEWGLESGKVGNATAYWRKTPPDGGFEIYSLPLGKEWLVTDMAKHHIRRFLARVVLSWFILGGLIGAGASIWNVGVVPTVNTLNFILGGAIAVLVWVMVWSVIQIRMWVRPPNVEVPT